MENQPAKCYYDDLGQAHDDVLRCLACRKLVPFQTIKKLGCCECGYKRFDEVRTLTDAERDSIVNGLLCFDNSDKFLQEFSHVEG